VGGGVAASPGVSQVSHYPIFDIKIYKEFSGIFSRNFIFEDFSEIGISIKTQKNEDEMISSKSKPGMQQL
jgi:hypothetical protein